MVSRGQYHHRIYALYKGENYVCDGTIDELVTLLGAKPATVKFYATPSYRKRVEARLERKRSGSIILEPIGWDDDSYEEN